MSESSQGSDTGPGQRGLATGDIIAAADGRALAEWAEKLDTTPQQLRQAIATVGDRAADVEMHLKGSHSTTNADRVERARDA